MQGTGGFPQACQQRSHAVKIQRSPLIEFTAHAGLRNILFSFVWPLNSVAPFNIAQTCVRRPVSFSGVLFCNHSSRSAPPVAGRTDAPKTILLGSCCCRLKLPSELRSQSTFSIHMFLLSQM